MEEKETTSPSQIFEKGFPHARPRCWQNKQRREKLLKVIPWYQPLGDESKFDFKGAFAELFPEMKDDLMHAERIYSGLVMHVGWLVENENRIWLGLAGVEMKDLFEDLGEWHEEKHRPLSPKTPVKP